ncbi:MAG TPA: hypothetical protein VHX88_16490 [Solirubrobacteraceae bacterium]|nr:hypothetical protein [Solirubrobacteraceae bacterium]
MAVTLAVMAVELVFASPYFNVAGVAGWMILTLILGYTAMAVSGVMAALAAMIFGDPRKAPYVLPSERTPVRREPLPVLPRSAAAMPLSAVSAPHGVPELPDVSSSWPTWPSDDELEYTRDAVAAGLVGGKPTMEHRSSWVPYGIRLWPLIGVFSVGFVAMLMFTILANQGPSLF